MKPLDFTRQYNNISPITLEEILETLEDNGYLSATGEQFRHKYWEMFIKE